MRNRMKRTKEDRDTYHQNQHVTDYDRKRSNESITPGENREYRSNIVRSTNFIHRNDHGSNTNDNIEIYQRRNEDKMTH